MHDSVPHRDCNMFSVGKHSSVWTVCPAIHSANIRIPIRAEKEAADCVHSHIMAGFRHKSPCLQLALIVHSSPFLQALASF